MFFKAFVLSRQPEPTDVVGNLSSLVIATTVAYRLQTDQLSLMGCKLLETILMYSFWAPSENPLDLSPGLDLHKGWLNDGWMDGQMG